MKEINKILLKWVIITSIVGKIIGDIICYYVFNVDLHTIIVRSLISIPIIFIVNFFVWFGVFKSILLLKKLNEKSE